MNLRQQPFSYLIVSLLLLLTASVNAASDSVKEFKDWQVHYIAFPSTFAQPEAAKAIGFKRRGNNAFVNISILDKNDDMRGVKTKVTGAAKNLLGQNKTLNFIEVDEGKAVYYMAEVSHSNEETLRFTINIARPNGGSYQVKFEQKLYVD